MLMPARPTVVVTPARMTLCVGGEAGVGKTRLVTRFAGQVRGSGGRVLLGGCIELGDGSLPYAPVVEALRGLGRGLELAALAIVITATSRCSMCASSWASTASSSRGLSRQRSPQGDHDHGAAVSPAHGERVGHLMGADRQPRLGLVAPLLLVGTVVLSFAAALGVSALVWNHVFRFSGADPAIPLFAFVFLVALGVDYNIFLMTRVNEESRRHGTRRGALIGLAATGGVITSAGLGHRP